MYYYMYIYCIILHMPPRNKCATGWTLSLNRLRIVQKGKTAHPLGEFLKMFMLLYSVVHIKSDRNSCQE